MCVCVCVHVLVRAPVRVCMCVHLYMCVCVCLEEMGREGETGFVNRPLDALHWAPCIGGGFCNCLGRVDTSIYSVQKSIAYMHC